MTKLEIIERLQLIADIANAPENGYHYEVIVNDWAKYGKDRTYFKIRETRENSKHFVEKDYGYFDNITETFAPGKSSIEYRFSGAKLTEADLSVKKEEPVVEEPVVEETVEAESAEEVPTEEAAEENSVSVMKIWCCRSPEIRFCEYSYCEADAFLKFRNLTNRGYSCTLYSVLVPFSEKSGFPVSANMLVSPKSETSIPSDFDWLVAICSNTFPEFSKAPENKTSIRFPEVSEDGAVSDPNDLIGSWKNSGWCGDVTEVIWYGDINDAPDFVENDIRVYHELNASTYIPAEHGFPVNRSVAFTKKYKMF